jgi:hypothetical protein
MFFARKPLPPGQNSGQQRRSWVWVWIWVWTMGVQGGKSGRDVGTRRLTAWVGKSTPTASRLSATMGYRALKL